MSQILKKLDELELELEESGGEEAPRPEALRPKPEVVASTPSLEPTISIELALDDPTPAPTRAPTPEPKPQTASTVSDLNPAPTRMLSLVESQAHSVSESIPSESSSAIEQTVSEVPPQSSETLDSPEASEENPTTERRPRVLAILLVLASAGAGGYFWQRQRAASTAATETPDPSAEAAAALGLQPAPVRYKEAQQMLIRDQGTLALGSFQQLDTESPGKLGVKLGLARSLELAARKDQAENQFKEAQKLSPQDPVLLNNYGIFLVRNGLPEKGLLLLEEAEHADPSLAGAILNQARAYELLSDWSGAIDAYDRYLLHPKRETRLVEAIERRLKKLEPLSKKQKTQDEDRDE